MSAAFASKADREASARNAGAAGWTVAPWANMPLPKMRDMALNLRHGRFSKVIASIADVVLTPFRRCLEYFGLASGICIYAVKRQGAK